MFRPQKCTHAAWISVAATLVGSSAVCAQPTNVRSWYAQGQVFVVWERPAPPALATDTVEVYASAAAQGNVANMQRVGKLFFPEYTGARLQQLQPAARLLIPTPAGGTYRLNPNEGAFALTPRSAGNLFFAVVDTGAVVVNAANSATAAFNYDPVNDPVRPHPQFVGTTTGGNPYTAYVVFADGRDDYNSSRPDVPVLGDADKNGVPHAFTITEPVGGVPATPLPVVFAHHGGGGEYELFRPGMGQRANVSLGLNSGIVVTPDDSYYAVLGNVLNRSNTSWFGYTPDADPFLFGPRSNPASTSIVVNFTSRRVHWILDWLQRPTSPYLIDSSRVAMIGHSGGGRGTSLLVRQRPERFCSAVVYTPASDLTIPPASADGNMDENFLRGDWVSPLSTNLLKSDGTPFNTVEVFTMTTRLSATERDFPLMRFYFGKRDEDGAASWSPAQRAVVDALNDAQAGFHIFWDEREHGVEKWNVETSDLTDDPAHTDPWPDVGQWIAPIKTRRPAAETMVNVFTNLQSYPGFFNADSDALLVGRQPDPGPGDPNLGDPFGTWGGYFDWDTSTLIDTRSEWAATIFATGLSAIVIDNSPFASFTTDLSPKRTRNFNPPLGKLVRYNVLDAATQTLLQSGSTGAQEDGIVEATGVIVPKDPARVRVVFRVCIADFNNNGVVETQDIFDMLNAFFTGSPTADVDGSGTVAVADIFTFLNRWFAGC